ncbi:MAG: hypothetical protein AAF985_13805 [Bacteroidota bacterium]
MKLRIRGNSIRLRLTQSEVSRFAEEGEIKASIQFGPGNALNYQLKMADCGDLQAQFDGSQIAIMVPKDMGHQWATSDEVGMEHLVKIDQQQSLKILIEKDFQCLTLRPGDEDSDTFPNPHSRHEVVESSKNQ